MARPERNSVDYFPFICEEGNKMFYIEEIYGNDGFATFIKLLRELAKTNYHYLDLSKQQTQMFLSAKCKVSKETLISIIDDLVELGKFDKKLWVENSIIWCQDFIDSIQDAYKKRNNKCITYEGLLTLLISLGVRKPDKSIINSHGNPQSKVKYSIVNKSVCNKEEILEQKKQKKIASFKESVKSTKIYKSGKYPNSMFIHFTEYWTAETKNKKLLFDVQKSFSFEARLRTWINNDQRYRDL